MTKSIKELEMAWIVSRVSDVRDMLVIDSSRLDGVTANRFRLALQDRSISALTVKNSLARRALNVLGVTALDEILSGPSTLVWGGEDIVALSKEIARWAKEVEGLEIKGGTVEGETLDSAAVDALSRSPSREELIGQIAGLALSPGARLVSAILGPGGTLAGQISSLGEREDE